MAKLLRKPLGKQPIMSLILWALITPITFSSPWLSNLAIKCSHYLCHSVWEDCTKKNGFQALAAGLNPAEKMTLDQFMAIFSVCRGHFTGLSAQIRETGRFQTQPSEGLTKDMGLNLPKMLSLYLKFILLTMLPHIELPNCRYNQRFSEITSHFCLLLSFTALIDTNFLYKSFIAANSRRIPA